MVLKITDDVAKQLRPKFRYAAVRGKTLADLAQIVDEELGEIKTPPTISLLFKKVVGKNLKELQDKPNYYARMINDAKEYLSQGTKVIDIPAKLGVSYFTAHKKFKEFTGETMGEYQERIGAKNNKKPKINIENEKNFSSFVLDLHNGLSINQAYKKSSFESRKEMNDAFLKFAKRTPKNYYEAFIEGKKVCL